MNKRMAGKEGKRKEGIYNNIIIKVARVNYIESYYKNSLFTQKKRCT